MVAHLWRTCRKKYQCNKFLSFIQLAQLICTTGNPIHIYIAVENSSQVLLPFSWDLSFCFSRRTILSISSFSVIQINGKTICQSISSFDSLVSCVCARQKMRELCPSLITLHLLGIAPQRTEKTDCENVVVMQWNNCRNWRPLELVYVCSRRMTWLDNASRWTLDKKQTVAVD